ncbi:hypothetical protein JCM8097_007982 [Rhodosporidiobolus ruineniae]
MSSPTLAATAGPKVRVRRMSLPSSVLPKLSRSLSTSNLSSDRLLELLNHLRLLYATPASDGAAQPDEAAVRTSHLAHEVDEDPTVDPLHQHDAFERSWAVNWLSLVVKRGHEWVDEAQQEGNDDERQRRTRIVDEAASLVSHMTATSESGSILRPLLLPTCAPDADPQSEPLLITLNDALPSSLDPTSVGLQSWGSSIILARMIALDPHAFGLGLPGQRVLELGAGTGLLSLVWKGMSERLGAPATVFATDYHDGVLENLKRNVISNSASISPATSPSASPGLHPINPSNGLHSSLPSLDSSLSSLPVQAHKLDWSAVHSSRTFSAALNPRNPIPTSMPPPFDKPFHSLLAADVVYGPTHALWLKSCVEQFLIKPDDPALKSATDQLPKEMADLSIGEASVPLPTRPALNSTQSSMPAIDVVATTHTSAATGAHAPSASSSSTSASASPSTAPSSTSSAPPEPVKAFTPAFHLIVPLRPTHAEAIATLKDVFPLREDLPPRDETAPGGGWRVAVQSLTEVERVQGVGRSDEETYRLYRIGWC